MIFLGECPLGIAWFDKAYGLDLAHQNVECSNEGICDRVTGICKCFHGFTGNACQRSNFFLIIFIIFIFIFNIKFSISLLPE